MLTRVIENLDNYFEKNRSSYIDTTGMSYDEKRKAVTESLFSKEKVL